MKTFFKNLKGGLTFGLGILIMLFIGGIVYASLSNVEEGDILSAQKWNELVGNVNDINLALDGGLASPSDAVMAFNRETCPSGWKAADGTNGTPDLRGVFIRGANSFGTGIRTDEYRDVDRANAGSGLLTYQDDTIRNITGSVGPQIVVWGVSSPGGYGAFSNSSSFAGLGATDAQPVRGRANITFDASGSVPTGSDNRPKNIALIYCVKE